LNTFPNGPGKLGPFLCQELFPEIHSSEPFSGEKGYIYDPSGEREL